MPPAACSKRPTLVATAPVKAPFSWPNSSDSSSCSGSAAQLTATKGLPARGEPWCRRCATTSLPVPDSPVISTVVSAEAHASDLLQHVAPRRRDADDAAAAAGLQLAGQPLDGRLQALGALARLGGGARFLGQPLVGEHEADAIGETARDVDILVAERAPARGGGS